MREAVNVLGTEAEKTLLVPGSTFYRELGEKLVEKQISVNAFLGAAQYADVATLASLVQVTGGQLFYYPAFQSDSPSMDALYGDLFHVLTRETGFEAVFRVRVSQGCKISLFSGNFCLSNTDLMVLPVCHADITVYLEFQLDTVLAAQQFVVQSALLYTNSRGERRIRVLTLSVPVSNVLAHLYERVNQDILVTALFRQSRRCVRRVSRRPEPPAGGPGGHAAEGVSSRRRAAEAPARAGAGAGRAAAQQAESPPALHGAAAGGASL